MKTTLSYVLVVLTFLTLFALPNSFAQDGSPEQVVRIDSFYSKRRRT